MLLFHKKIPSWSHVILRLKFRLGSLTVKPRSTKPLHPLRITSHMPSISHSVVLPSWSHIPLLQWLLPGLTFKLPQFSLLLQHTFPKRRIPEIVLMDCPLGTLHTHVHGTVPKFLPVQLFFQDTVSSTPLAKRQCVP